MVVVVAAAVEVFPQEARAGLDEDDRVTSRLPAPPCLSFRGNNNNSNDDDDAKDDDDVSAVPLLVGCPIPAITSVLRVTTTTTTHILSTTRSSLFDITSSRKDPVKNSRRKVLSLVASLLLHRGT